jgi:hypothetical protein
MQIVQTKASEHASQQSKLSSAAPLAARAHGAISRLPLRCTVLTIGVSAVITQYRGTARHSWSAGELRTKRGLALLRGGALLVTMPRPPVHAGVRTADISSVCPGLPRPSLISYSTYEVHTGRTQ